MTKHTPITPAPTDAQPHPHTLPDEALVPVAPRQDGWTPERQRSFIETLADTGCVATAAQHVGMSPASAYRLRRRTDARAFDAAWDAALERSMERLLPVAIERALHGWLKPRYYHGELIAQEHVHSERLLLWLLEKGAAMLGNSRARQAMRGDWDAALEGVGLAESRAPEPQRPYRTWVDAAQKAWLTDAPPQPGYEGWCRGRPGDAHFARLLQPEEQAALARAEQAPQVSPWQDEARRRFFGLAPVRAYAPEDADAWLAQAAAQPTTPETDTDAETPAPHGAEMTGPETPQQAESPLAAPPAGASLPAEPARAAPPPAASAIAIAAAMAAPRPATPRMPAGASSRTDAHPDVLPEGGPDAAFTTPLPFAPRAPEKIYAIQ
ncbi:hypothetical protein [Sphingobium nicotianae]|uniref:Uncharacterized protein n=1 Tax=Sphingobium nicotianae TaxID=2782607 RepID=A0A9X1D9N9_9SPHN|nr:hypothetical protein [Sphingobium nicotianae]MBT2185949.1 hypothetical protein [Sphingobium nicotianae]